jgi:hypothetical protein
VSLYSPGWPEISDSTASESPVLGLEGVCYHTGLISNSYQEFIGLGASGSNL